MRAPFTILLSLALASSPAHPNRTSPHTPRTPAEITGDSLYDAGAVDSLLAFSTRMIDRASVRHDSVLAGRMIYHRGRARLALRDARAPEDFARALAMATALSDSAGRMQALGLQAFVAVNQGRFDESIRLNRERIALARALGRRGSEAWGHLLIGYAEYIRENLSPALAEYEEAWRGFGEAKRPRQQLAASIGLGNVLERMGRHHDARTSYQKAWLTARELGDRAQESDVINNLGGMEQEHGGLSLAAAYFQRAYEIKRELGTFDIAATARNVADSDQMIGRYAHAESTLTEAMSFKNDGMLDAGMAVDVGRLRLARGRNVAAVRSFREVLAQGDRVTGKTRTDAATYLAAALLEADSASTASAIMESETRRIAHDAQSAWRTSAFLMCSRCRRAQGDAVGARDMALRAFNDATARTDSSLMVSAAAELSLCERAAGHDEDALRWLERGSAAFEAARAAGDFQWREARRSALASSLLECSDLLRVAPREQPEETRMRALFDFLQQVQSRTLLERVTDPRRFGEVDPALARPPTSLALQERVLAAGECFFLASVTRGHIYVFALTRDEFRTGVIDDADGAFERRARNYARLCAHPPTNGAGNDMGDAARALGAVLFGATGGTVRSSSRVCAALDGYLAGFPLETLVCPGEDAPLGASHETVRVPSAAFLAYLRARPDAPVAESAVLAVASNATDLSGARGEVDHLGARYGATRALSPTRNEFLADLSGYDVVHIASHVHVDGERPWNSGILIGEHLPAGAERRAQDSTSAQPLSLSAAESRQVAAHLPADPFVRASEVASRRTSARLVVLSACESAIGRATMAEGVLGIASSFVSAGSRAVVASLWQVDDRTTAELMRHFYRELAAGKSTAAALRGARLDLRKDHPEPFFWAGFVVIGDGNVTVALRPRPLWHRPALLLAGLILVSTWPLAVWRRRKDRVRIAA